MACKVSPAFYAVLILGVVAIGLHVVGYATPGWLVMSRKFTVEEIKLTSTTLIEEAFRMEEVDADDSSEQRIDDGGVPVPREENIPSMDDMPDMMPEHESHESHGTDGRHPHPHPHPHPRPHHRRRHHPHMEVIEEMTQVTQMLQESVVEIDHVYVKIMYGLWKSKLCVKTKMEHMDEEDMDDQDMDDSSSSSSSSDSGHKKHCRCKILSTKCALHLSTMFVDMPEMMEVEAEEKQPWYKFNTKYFLGNTCLTEHQVESSIGLAMLVIAVFAGIMFFRKQDSCKCWSIVCLIGLVTAFVLVSIPAHRVLRHNYHHVRDHMTASRTHTPFSLVATLTSALLMFILAIVVAVSLCRRRRYTKQWARFENDAIDSEGEKKSGMPPSLVFIPEPLTGKAGLYDIWGDVKPLEYVEPEKKPLE